MIDPVATTKCPSCGLTLSECGASARARKRLGDDVACYEALVKQCGRMLATIGQGPLPMDKRSRARARWARSRAYGRQLAIDALARALEDEFVPSARNAIRCAIRLLRVEGGDPEVQTNLEIKREVLGSKGLIHASTPTPRVSNMGIR